MISSRADDVSFQSPGYAAPLDAARHDAERLAAVRATGLLDSDAEEAFDRLTRLAVRLVGVPAAFISLVDANRDFYKSTCGFGEPLASERELSGETFCHYAIQSTTPLVIPDTAADPGYRNVPTVTSLGVAAYVGVPLIVGGQVIGAFCSIDTKPRAWTPDEVEVLVELAASAQREIELRSAASAAVLAATALRQSESRYRTLAETVPVQVWSADADGLLTFVSRHTVQFFGVPAAQLLGAGWGAFVHPDDLPNVLERWTHSITTGTPYQAEFRVRSSEGNYRWHLVRALPERDPSGMVIGWVGSNTDMQAEREARAEAENANRSKSRFLAMMSHELRTPLNAIGGYSALLAEGIKGPMSPDQQDYLVRIQRSQRHLLGLIDGILSYAKLDAGAVTYAVETVAVDEVIAISEALTAPQIREKRLRFEHVPMKPPLAVRGDREKIQQIVVNLLSNAVKFTEPEGRITVACSLEDAHTVAVRVSDTGHGIASDQLERVFQPFVQVDSQQALSKQGTGLGLAISREFAGGMGGTLTVNSEPGVGSTFTLLLPSA